MTQTNNQIHTHTNSDVSHRSSLNLDLPATHAERSKSKPGDNSTLQPKKSPSGQPWSPNVQVLDLAATDSSLRGFRGGFAAGDYGYFVPNYNNGDFSGKVARVDLATFSQVQVLDLAATDPDLKGFSGGFTSGGYGYFVPNKNNLGVNFGKVARVDLATFSQVQVLDLAATDPDLEGFEGGFASSGYGYFVPNYNYRFFLDFSGKVARVELANFSQVQVLDLTTTDYDLQGFLGGFESGGYGYFVPYYSNADFSGRIWRGW